MGNLSLLSLAVALAMDATAVAAAQGLANRGLRFVDTLRMALWFGLFQGLMPVVGFFLGERLGPIVGSWGRALALVVLIGLGVKMLIDARSDEGQQASPELSKRMLFALAVATSIDALAVGVTLPILGAALWSSVLTIAIVTAAMSAAGAVAGRHFGARFGQGLVRLGGWILIALGLKLGLEPLGLF